MGRAALWTALLGLTAAAGWLAWGLAVDHVDEPEGFADMAMAPTAETVPAVSPMPRFALPPRQHYASVTGRPLFALTRRPAVPEPVVPEDVAEAPEAATLEAAAPAAPQPAPPPPLDITLRGIVVDGARRIAIAGPAGDTRPRALRQGDRYAGWIVIEILPGAVILRTKDTETLVTLAYKTSERGE